MPTTIKLRVYGSTSNLGAGFDALGLAVKLPLRVNLRLARRAKTTISARGEGANEIKQVENNLILHAFEHACRKAGKSMPALTLNLHNRIPLKRGLGSSGAAIVAGLLGAQVYCENPFSIQQLLDMACELEGHPENASASLLGGLTVNKVHEGRVICAQFSPPSAWGAVCFVPDLEIATEDARRVLPETLKRHEAIGNLQSATMMVAAFAQHKPDLLAFATQDFLHQPYRKNLIPGYDAVIAAALASGAFCAFLSGSGSTMLAICTAEPSFKIAEEMSRAAHANGLPGRTMSLGFAHVPAEVIIADR